MLVGYLGLGLKQSIYFQMQNIKLKIEEPLKKFPVKVPKSIKMPEPWSSPVSSLFHPHWAHLSLGHFDSPPKIGSLGFLKSKFSGHNTVRCLFEEHTNSLS